MNTTMRRAAACLMLILLVAAGGCRNIMLSDELATLEMQQQQLDTKLSRIDATLNRIRMDMRQLAGSAQPYEAQSSVAASAPVRPPSASDRASTSSATADAQSNTINVQPRASASPASGQKVPAAPSPVGSFTRIEPVSPLPVAGPVKVRLPGRIHFASGKTEVDAAGRELLAQMAEVIQRDYPNATIRVEGFSDTDPITKSSWSSNRELSQQRADAAARYLATQGIAAGRIEAIGMGDAQPQATKSASRRVEVSVMLDR